MLAVCVSLSLPLFVLIAIMCQEKVDYVRAVHEENEENCTTRGYRSYSCITTFSRRLFFPPPLLFISFFFSRLQTELRTEKASQQRTREQKKEKKDAHDPMSQEARKCLLDDATISARLVSLLLLASLLTPSLQRENLSSARKQRS